MEGMASYMAKDERPTRPDVPARRGGQRLDPVDHPARRLRLLRLPLRPRGVRLHRGALGQGGLPRLPLRVPQHPRRPRRPGARARASASTPRTSTSSSGAGCARSTCRSWSRPASRPTSAARSATRTSEIVAARSRRPPRPRATWSPRSRSPAATSTSCSSTRDSAGRSRNLTKGYHRRLPVPGGAAHDRRPRDGPRPRLLARRQPARAAFAKRESGRSLLLFDVLDAEARPRSIDMDVEQQHGPAWSPDGRTVAFSGNRGGPVRHLRRSTSRRGEISNLTNDETYDGAPVYSPDGALDRLSRRWSARTTPSSSGSTSPTRRSAAADRRRVATTRTRSIRRRRRLALLHLRPQRHRQHLRHGARDRRDRAVHQRGHRLLHADRPAAASDGVDRLVYTGFWRGDFDLYLSATSTGRSASRSRAAARRRHRRRGSRSRRSSPTSRSRSTRRNKERVRRLQALPRGRRRHRSASPTTRSSSATPTSRSPTTSATAG